MTRKARRRSISRRSARSRSIGVRNPSGLVCTFISGSPTACSWSLIARHRVTPKASTRITASTRRRRLAARRPSCRSSSTTSMRPTRRRSMPGKWVGEGTNETGAQGSGYFTFESDLQRKAWLRRNHSEYPSTTGRPAAVHEDLMIVYADAGTVRAFYTDTENHTIPYRVSFSDDKKIVTFVSDRLAGQPRYRLAYV